MVWNQVNKNLRYRSGMLCSNTIADGVAVRPNRGIRKPIRTNARTIEIRGLRGAGRASRALCRCNVERQVGLARGIHGISYGYAHGSPGSRRCSGNCSGLAIDCEPCGQIISHSPAIGRHATACRKGRRVRYSGLARGERGGGDFGRVADGQEQRARGSPDCKFLTTTGTMEACATAWVEILAANCC